MPAGILSSHIAFSPLPAHSTLVPLQAILTLLVEILPALLTLDHVLTRDGVHGRWECTRAPTHFPSGRTPSQCVTHATQRYPSWVTLFFRLYLPYQSV